MTTEALPADTAADTVTDTAPKDGIDVADILRHGLDNGNVGLVQLLGLCPLLAVSNTAVNALGLGLATLLSVSLTNFVVSTVRHLAGRDVRIPAFVMIIAAVVTALELAMRAWLPALYAVLGLFIPLIVTNCAIMGRAEAFASRNRPLPALLDGFATGLGFLWVLLALGALFLAPARTRRELWPWVAVALFGLLAALGVYAVVHGWLTVLLPGFAAFRAPARAIVLP